ncbi:MAG: ABC transporter substrate-binding protein [Armatimonadota bacterium]
MSRLPEAHPRVVAGCLLALLVVTAIGSQPASPAPQPVRVVISTDRDITNVDPAAISTPADYTVAYLVSSSLVRVKPGTRVLEPDLAQRWEVSNDGLVYTFHLRRGVKWQNDLGEVTAEDVIAHFQRVASKESGSLFFVDLEPISKMEAPDRYTVRLTMRQPYPAFMTAVIAYRPGLIVPKRAILSNPASLKTNPVGSGPYVFASWRQGAEVVLRANPDYYAGAPAVGEVVMKIVREDETALLALQRGEIDARYVQVPEVQRQVQSVKELRVLTSPMPRTYYIALNTTRAPFNDVRVRRALWYGLNRKSIVERVFNSKGTVADTVVPPVVEGHLSRRVYSYDPSKAKQLLKEAGFQEGADRTLSIMTTGLRDLSDIAAVAQDNWKALGVNVRVEIVDTPVLLQRARTGNFDMMNWAQLRTEPEQFLVSFFHSNNINSTNYSRYDKIDSILDGFRTAIDRRERLRLIGEAQRQLQQDAPHIPVLNPTLMLVHTPRLQGPKLGLLIFNVWEWSASR